jgi:hypothetical protein
MLSRLLGHANPTVNQNIYIHVIGPDLPQAGQNLSISLPTGRKGKKGQERGK